MITLVIVNCQNDFITGAMRVKGGSKVLDNIKSFIKNNVKEIDKILLVADWHPFKNCSFKKDGGQFPTHCVKYTPGACIEPKLLKLINSLNINYEVVTAGEFSECEQKGAFREIEYVSDNYFNSCYYFDSIYSADSSTDFVICGVNGDTCGVKYAIENLIKGDIIPTIYSNGIVSTDVDDFTQFIHTNNLKEYVKSSEEQVNEN